MTDDGQGGGGQTQVDQANRWYQDRFDHLFGVLGYPPDEARAQAQAEALARFPEVREGLTEPFGSEGGADGPDHHPPALPVEAALVADHAARAQRAEPAVVRRIGHYVFNTQDEVGRGGFGIVYRARDDRDASGTLFAIKLLFPHMRSERARFFREAVIARCANSDYLVSIYEFGNYSTDINMRL